VTHCVDYSVTFRDVGIMNFGRKKVLYKQYIFDNDGKKPSRPFDLYR